MCKNWTKDCTLCPRTCHANREAGKKGYCKTGSKLTAARAALHFWEEPCISGEKGSGAVFFSGCNLGCVYCQNRAISGGEAGKEITVSRLAEIFFELKDKGAQNINLVTPTHFVPPIREALILAKERNLDLPVVYNCGGYEQVETIRMLEGLVDIYLPDFKYLSCALAKKYSFAPDYPDAAKKAISEMFRQTGPPVFDTDGRMTRGLIVRHLMLPGQLADSKRVLKTLFDTYGNQIYYSIMNQYTPLAGLEQYPELNHRISSEEYEELIDFAVDLGIENGFVQEGGTAEESFIPAFDGEGLEPPDGQSYSQQREESRG